MATAQAAKQEAVGRVAMHANPEWVQMAFQGVETLARIHAEFTTDNLWQFMETLGRGVSTHEPRALGPVMIAAQKRHWIAPTGRYEQSRRPACHLRPIAIWKSLIYRRDA